MRQLIFLFLVGAVLLMTPAIVTPASACPCCQHVGFPGICYDTIPCEDYSCHRSIRNNAISKKINLLLKQNGVNARVKAITLRAVSPKSYRLRGRRQHARTSKN
jgi:hypothetical protein